MKTLFFILLSMSAISALADDQISVTVNGKSYSCSADGGGMNRCVCQTGQIGSWFGFSLWNSGRNVDGSNGANYKSAAEALAACEDYKIRVPDCYK